MGKRTSIVVKLGPRVRARRIAQGWTQKKLCKKAGISNSYLSDLENGKRGASGSVLVALADALMMTTDYMLGR
jgi:transcriptional regulator with XRE-family HTH domain